MALNSATFVSSSFLAVAQDRHRLASVSRRPCFLSCPRPSRFVSSTASPRMTNVATPQDGKSSFARRATTAAAATLLSLLLPLSPHGVGLAGVRYRPTQAVAVTGRDLRNSRIHRLFPANAVVEVNPETTSVPKTRKEALRILPRHGDPLIHVALKYALMLGMATSVITIATIAVFWIIQDTLVYKPTGVWRGTPKSWDMPYYEDVSYCTLDNVEITGWFIKQPPGTFENARTLIYFHGTDKNASFRLKKVVGFYEQCRCNILLLSYRGYGLSTGKPNEKGVRIDAESAFEYLKSRGDIDVSPGGKLWVFGESLGGAVAIHFVSVFEKHVNALILENTFTSLLDMIKLEFPILGIFRYLSRNKWQSKKRIGKLRLPILFLSGARDGYIPPRMMRQMYELANNVKVREFVEFEQGTHNRTWTLDGFYTVVADFMNRVESKENPLTPPAHVSNTVTDPSAANDGQDVVTAAA